jgi:hypothetical protein
VSRLAALLLLLLFATPTLPQAMHDPCEPQRIGENPEHYQQRRIMNGCEAQDRMKRTAEKQWNKERQAKLKADTDKLLELATQLKQQVDKSNENVLSLDVMKKAEEIEKLAHSVHDRMKADGY